MRRQILGAAAASADQAPQLALQFEVMELGEEQHRWTLDLDSAAL